MPHVFKALQVGRCVVVNHFAAPLSRVVFVHPGSHTTSHHVTDQNRRLRIRSCGVCKQHDDGDPPDALVQDTRRIAYGDAQLAHVSEHAENVHTGRGSATERNLRHREASAASVDVPSGCVVPDQETGSSSFSRCCICAFRRARIELCICETRDSERSSVDPISFIVIPS